MIMSITGLDIDGNYIYEESTGLVDDSPDHGVDVKIHFTHDPSPAPYEQTRNRNTTTFTFTENEMETVFELQGTICELDTVVSDVKKIIKMLELAYEMGRDNPRGKYNYNDFRTTLTLLEESELDYE